MDLHAFQLTNIVTVKYVIYLHRNKKKEMDVSWVCSKTQQHRQENTYTSPLFLLYTKTTFFGMALSPCACRFNL